VWGTTRAPWISTLVVGILAAILCTQSNLFTVVTFTAVLIITLYGLIAICALVSRLRQEHLPRPWKLPLWPVPPVIALVGVVIALTQQKHTDLLIVAGIFIAGLIYYYGFIRPREDRYWYMSTDPEKELAALEGQP
jgi:amino acid transporter